MQRSILEVILSIINNNNLTYRAGFGYKKTITFGTRKIQIGGTEGKLLNPFYVLKPYILRGLMIVIRI